MDTDGSTMVIHCGLLFAFALVRRSLRWTFSRRPRLP
jgi:hypothetical protein